MAPVSSSIFNAQGLLTGLNSLSGIFSLRLAQKNAEVLDISIPAMHAIDLGAISFGITWVLAGHRNDRTIMKLSIPGRLLAGIVFQQYGDSWKDVVYETVGAAAAGLGLWWDLLKEKQGDSKRLRFNIKLVRWGMSTL
ncbi:hypothetical protein BJ878DRAFT_543273 [Calycina marina]|uniref:Uncharacterized protein n=1 Tax=Calycina marina TaxID=1763456 RepID=A0A9P7Z0P4_9HELO|nr:hypothetical protein BJ878DRAFT_543273 [Calycina marina]